MRPPTNTSAPGVLLPPTLAASASTHAAHRGNAIPIYPKAIPQAEMRPSPHPATGWPHSRDRPATTMGRLPPPSDTGKRVSPAPVVSRHLQARSQRERSPKASLHGKTGYRESNTNSTPPNCFHSYGPATEKDNYTRNSSSSRYKSIIPRYDQSRGTAREQLLRVLLTATGSSTLSRVPRPPAAPGRPAPFHILSPFV